MSEKYHVKDVTEAIALAESFKSTGQYNLFRGQGRNWRVKSTFERLSKKQSEKIKEQLVRLYHYFDTDSFLRKFNLDIDWFYAVAQHYGISTNYIDFTSSAEVAAFFSTNSKSNQVGEECEIICLNENDFNTFLKVASQVLIPPEVVPPKIVRVNVDNLWRLQAQQGCFLYTPLADIECYYDFDRITFPFVKSSGKLTKQEIYPDRKSELEILLDHYFNAEQRLAGQIRFTVFAEECNIPAVTLAPPDIPKAIKHNEKHASWNSPIFTEWKYTIEEEWKPMKIANLVKLRFSFKNDITAQIDLLANDLSLYFENNRIARTDPLLFEVTATPKLTNKMSKIINRSCTRIWDGTRNLPYTNADICKMISKYICLEIYEDKFNDIPSLSSEKLIILELTNGSNSMTRCPVTQRKVVEAFRTDIKDVLAEELAQNVSSEILLAINIPSLLFDFHKLIDLFKDEMISYQVLYNSENEYPVIFYTPTQVEIMGYA